MKTTLTLYLALSILTVFGQTKVLSLENNKGIVEDSLGSVTLWENQIDGYGDATQAISALGAEQMQETYPGKVTVAFSKDGSFLELEGTSASLADNNYSIFYVGRANPTDKPVSLLGNYDIDGSFAKCSGMRLEKSSTGAITFDYARPNFVRTTLSTIPGDGFFFFGFTMDASGNYRYFDSNSSLIVEGKFNNTMVTNTEDIKLNLLEENGGTKTYDHSEVVEIVMYDGTLSDTDFDLEYARLAAEYPELVTAEFSVTEVLPAERLNLPVASPITLTCDQAIDATSVFPKIYVNKSETEASGNWVLSPANTLTFTPTQNWPTDALVSVEVVEGLLSTDSVSIDLSKGAVYSFIVETDKDYGACQQLLIDTMAMVDYPQANHVLQLKLAIPTNIPEKMPVHIWVHGGGWSGGTAALSNAANSPHRVYLAENMGIATLSISYRCKGSSGNFGLAMEDVATAYQWAKDNAETYNFDMTKVFLSGGSAGSPLAALSAQQLEGVIGFIGFNGIYDFVNDAGSWGSANDFGQETPTATANSPIFNLRDTPPATIMMHGDADNTIPYTQSTAFADAINAAGGEAEAVIYPGEVHAFFNLGKPAYEDVLIEMVNFMRQVLEDQETTAVDEIHSDDEHMHIYPNPISSGESLNIRLNATHTDQNLRVEIINCFGQTLQDSSVEIARGSNTFDVNINKLKQGNYILKISSDQMVESRLFVVE